MIRKLNMLLLLLLTTSLACGSIQQTKVNNNEQAVQMKNIEFIPKEFNDVVLGYYENYENKCSPKFKTGVVPLNTIALNAPLKIIYNAKNEKLEPIIPICFVYMISLKRAFKYHKLSGMMLHIRNLDENTVYSGEIIDKDLEYETPALPPHYEEMEKEKIAKEQEAQKYSEDELNEGQGGGAHKNINLMEYVNLLFKAGRYEVYMSFYDLESNRAIVEIIEK